MAPQRSVSGKISATFRNITLPNEMAELPVQLPSAVIVAGSRTFADRGADPTDRLNFVPAEFWP
ncbi:MAG: hypothetical protein HY673_07155 [Chloroflexi bacterium]|nr:hypothetical protein [Chloroflexota bacterium]